MTSQLAYDQEKAWEKKHQEFLDMKKERDEMLQVLRSTYGINCSTCSLSMCLGRSAKILCLNAPVRGYECPPKGRRHDCPFLPFEVRK
jgi:hypothetical protein